MSEGIRAQPVPNDFNPRPLCRGRPQIVAAVPVKQLPFQSTPPMQGATCCRRSRPLAPDNFNPRPLCRGRLSTLNLTRAKYMYFNPRPLCRGRRTKPGSPQCSSGISIHAPYAGGDCTRAEMAQVLGLFQSTPPMQGATGACTGCGRGRNISIHAPYAGGDSSSSSQSIPTYPFQSTPPMQGATPLWLVLRVQRFHFNPRPLCRGRPCWLKYSCTAAQISIHAPYAGGDLFYTLNTCSFNIISIHAPYAGGDYSVQSILPTYFTISIHAPYAGGDTKDDVTSRAGISFQSTPPMQGATPDSALKCPFGDISIHAPYAGGDSGHLRSA